MTKRFSIFTRIFVATAICLVIGLGATAWALSLVYARALERNIDNVIESQSDQLIGSILDEEEPEDWSFQNIDPRYQELGSGWYWQITDINGSPLATSPSTFGVDLPDLKIPFDDQNRRRADLRDADGILQRVSERKLFTQHGDYRVLVTANWDELNADVALFRNQTILALTAVGIVLALLAALIARVSLGPMKELRDEIGLVKDGKAEQIEGVYPPEMAPVKDELNALLSTNREIVRQAQNHVGNLAHGLKTPLAVLRNEARAKDEIESKMVRTQLQRMEEIVQRYLQRAQMAARSQIQTTHTPLVPALERLLGAMRKIHHPIQYHWRNTDAADALSVRMDSGDLDEVLGNILDNAGKWAKSQVSIKTEYNHNQIEITICDDGEGVPQQKLKKIAERGHRLDENTHGSGLGLDIVKELVQLSGGRVNFECPQDSGLAVCLTLPCRKR
ncbi:sensor histidine kinase [Maritalea mediterranea]|uniref:histidine kinase n=1 Tax=Maritalea mediterranea TaxID=2909667 RepID=A0ABS9E7R6_9HYPH|nr:HAMP domain-containing sensor histidine kinase [Maritalea mediterranea]MCF4097949.1 HAMP domain-containing histidine kinase [Maritalea mediterranea]